jgi:hypothetical protein
MEKPTKRASITAAIAVAAVAGLALLSSAVAGPSASYNRAIYKLTVTSPADIGGTPTTEWVSLSDGTWQADLDDQTFVASADSYVIVDRDSGTVYRRTGPPSFMGDLGQAPDGVLALKAHLKGDTTLQRRGLHLKVGKDQAGRVKLDVLDAADKQVLVVTIDGQISDEDAAAARLLDVNPPQVHVRDTAMPVGKAPTTGPVAYWFGPAVGNWHAAAAAAHSRVRTPEQVMSGQGARAESNAVVTLYEHPGVKATSAQPGILSRPDGELQIVSEPVTSAHAQGLIDAFNGKNGDETYAPWPRSTVTLASGEQATVVPSQFDGDGPSRESFFVITSTTLVQISGDVALSEIPGLAAQLRRLK